jgi:hypothetical protein
MLKKVVGVYGIIGCVAGGTHLFGTQIRKDEILKDVDPVIRDSSFYNVFTVYSTLYSTVAWPVWFYEFFAPCHFNYISFKESQFTRMMYRTMPTSQRLWITARVAEETDKEIGTVFSDLKKIE